MRAAFCNVIIYLLSASPGRSNDEARRTKGRKRDGVTMGPDKHLGATERAECAVDHRVTRRRWLLSLRRRTSSDVSTPPRRAIAINECARSFDRATENEPLSAKSVLPYTRWQSREFFPLDERKKFPGFLWKSSLVNWKVFCRRRDGISDVAWIAKKRKKFYLLRRVAIVDEFYAFDLMEIRICKKNMLQNWPWPWISIFFFFCIALHSSRG